MTMGCGLLSNQCSASQFERIRFYWQENSKEKNGDEVEEREEKKKNNIPPNEQSAVSSRNKSLPLSHAGREKGRLLY